MSVAIDRRLYTHCQTPRSCWYSATLPDVVQRTKDCHCARHLSSQFRRSSLGSTGRSRCDREEISGRGRRRARVGVRGRPAAVAAAAAPAAGANRHRGGVAAPAARAAAPKTAAVTVACRRRPRLVPLGVAAARPGPPRLAKEPPRRARIAVALAALGCWHVWRRRVDPSGRGGDGGMAPRPTRPPHPPAPVLAAPRGSPSSALAIPRRWGVPLTRAAQPLGHLHGWQAPGDPRPSPAVAVWQQRSRGRGRPRRVRADRRGRA